MHWKDLIKHLIKEERYRPTVVSVEMGRSRGYLNRYLYRTSIPNVELYAEILDHMGHDLIARNRKSGEEFVIDPPAHKE